MIEQRIDAKAAKPAAPKPTPAKPHPSWTFALHGDYGPRAYLTDSNGDAPTVLVRVNGRGVKFWIGSPPWGVGDCAMEFPGADLNRQALRSYADSLIAKLRDLALAKKEEVQSRRGGR